MAKQDAVWTEIDPTSLPAEIAKAYVDYKEAYKMMKDQRVAFEATMADMAAVPEGKRLVFGYNFGKLSVALVDDDRKPAKVTPAKQSLAEFIAGQAAAGRRV